MTMTVDLMMLIANAGVDKKFCLQLIKMIILLLMMMMLKIVIESCLQLVKMRFRAHQRVLNTCPETALSPMTHHDHDQDHDHGHG